MRKLIFSINITLDGFIDHTAGIADEELHQRATEMLQSADTLLFGRVGYQIMADYWPTARSDPSLPPALQEFADAINGMKKIVYSRTLEKVSWNTTIAREVDPDEIRALKGLPGKYILLGPGAKIAQAFMRLDLIDEYRFVVHPVILGRGNPLFSANEKRKDLALVDQYTLHSGVVELVYQPVKDPKTAFLSVLPRPI